MTYSFSLADAETGLDLGIMEQPNEVSCAHAFKRTSRLVTKMFPNSRVRIAFRGFKSSFGPVFDSFVQTHKDECYDEDGNFDWGEYQRLCDIADYWDMDS